MDARYLRLYSNLGLPLPAGEKVVIEVAVMDGLLPDMHLAYTGGRMVVPSPTLHQAPAELSEAEIFGQSVALLLGEKAVDEWQNTLFAPGEGMNRAIMAAGLRVWQLWEFAGPLAAGRHEIVKWLYVDPLEKSQETNKRLPKSYEQICSVYWSWKLSPASLSFLLTCTDIDLEPLMYAQRAPIYLRDLARPAYTRPTSADWQPEYQAAGAWGEALALATVVEYAVADYGRARLPELLHAFSQHHRWGTLIPAVFGVSADEFEAGWQRHLAEQYGVSIP